MLAPGALHCCTACINTRAFTVPESRHRWDWIAALGPRKKLNNKNTWTHLPLLGCCIGRLFVYGPLGCIHTVFVRSSALLSIGSTRYITYVDEHCLAIPHSSSNWKRSPRPQVAPTASLHFLHCFCVRRISSPHNLFCS